MSLTKSLRNSGFDLIEGPVRNHSLLQIWQKPPFDGARLYYSDINYAFVNPVTVLNVVETPALDVTATQKDNYGFNVGVTILQDILNSLGLGNFDVAANVKTGKSVSISYDNAVTRQVTAGDIIDYLSGADFKNPGNKKLLDTANANELLLVNGVIVAKNLIIEIDHNTTVDADIAIELTNLVDGKIKFTVDTENNLKMISSNNVAFPIAIQANRLHYYKGKFDGMNMVTDNRNFF